MRQNLSFFVNISNFTPSFEQSFSSTKLVFILSDISSGKKLFTFSTLFSNNNFSILEIVCNSSKVYGENELFHSISAFCNAGFDLMGAKTGQFSSITSFSDNIYATIVFSVLIVSGGIGFLTWEDIVTKRTRFKEYRMQSKVIIYTTIVLLVIPAIVFFFQDKISKSYQL